MENYIASLEKEFSLIENGFKEEEKRALSDYRSNDKEFVKKLAFSAYNSNTYQVRMYGVFLFGYLSEQNDILTFMRDEVSKDDNWRVQEVLAKVFDEFCKNTGYEKALPIIDEWLENDNPNTRRAVTEGLRIWTSRPYFKDNPNEAIRRIVALKEDPSEYVRKSVGNALRDISKKFPELIKDELNNWKLESKEINQVYKNKGVNYMMYNPQLDTFICVVEAGSFSKAAEELYISAPAVIKQINSLENSLNLQLFERTHRGLIITEAGKSLYQDAKYLIQYSKESLIRAQEAMNHNEEIIRVGISPMTPPEVFVELWPKIQKIYPEMKFKLITFENTPENAREILANMGKNIDVIAGIFDETMLELRGCDGTEISREPFCVAVSIHHRLAKKEKITLDDLAGENLMLMQRGWSYYGDILRDDMMKNHPEINIVDFNLYNVEAFNRCENNNEVLLAFKSWESVHPLIRIIPVEWDYTMPFGILHSKKPSIKVKRLINAINKVK